jgi:LysM repeat protein
MHHSCIVQAAFLVSATFAGRNPLGSPAKSARTHARRLPSAAAPALLGVAAAVAVAAMPATAFAATQAPAHHAAAAAVAHRSGPGGERLLSATRTAAKHAAAVPAKYTVKSGDSLSAIAGRVYKNSAFWPVLYWANHKQIRYANVIEVGQVLTVPAKPAHVPNAPSVLGPTPPPAPVAATSSTSGYSASSAPAYSAPTYSAPVQSTTYSGSGGSSYQQCVIARESGGNSQVMNSSGHYGLYQFSSGTWSAYGGNPADFGHASVAEQNQVFNNAIAAGGQSNWSPYDGC